MYLTFGAAMFQLMSRTSFAHRFVSLLCGVSFALFSLSTNVVRPCPMHGTGGHDMSANMGQAHGSHHAPASPSSVPQHSCKCGTTCCSAPLVAMLTVPLLVSVTEVDAASAPLPPLLAAPAFVREHALPFAIGPPATVRG